MPPYCHICSMRQRPPNQPRPIYHRHLSAKEFRVSQRVEYWGPWIEIPPSYFCVTCERRHLAKPETGLDICLSTSQLHDFHYPRERGVRCPPDTSHVDWVTIAGGTISDLTDAYYNDYKREKRPQRIVFFGGLNDLIKGGTTETVLESLGGLRSVVEDQNQFHPQTRNELSIATFLNPPKLCWFPNNPPPPPGYINMVGEIIELNSRITELNRENGRYYAPQFHTLGIRTLNRTKAHKWNQWRASEPNWDKLHLSDKWRIRAGQAIVKYFEGERSRYGNLV